MSIYLNVCIRHIFCESLVKVCAFKHKCIHFCDIYFRPCFRPNKKSRKSKLDHVRITFDKVWYFSKYFMLLHKLVYALDTLQSNDDEDNDERQIDEQTEFWNYWQTDISYVCLIVYCILKYKPLHSRCKQQPGYKQVTTDVRIIPELQHRDTETQKHRKIDIETQRHRINQKFSITINRKSLSENSPLFR